MSQGHLGECRHASFRASETELQETADATGRGKTVVPVGAPDGKCPRALH